MGHASPKYTAEFKQRAVQLYRERGGTYAEIGRELGVDCVSMLLYIVKGFGVLGWLVRGGDGLDPECGASFEFG